MSLMSASRRARLFVAIGATAFLGLSAQSLWAGTSGAVRFLRDVCMLDGTVYFDCYTLPGAECCSSFHACVPDCAPMD